MGRGVYLGVSHARLAYQESEVPDLPIFGVLLYLCVYTPLAQNDQIRQVTRMGKDMFSYAGQSRHFICTNASRGLSATHTRIDRCAIVYGCLSITRWNAVRRREVSRIAEMTCQWAHSRSLLIALIPISLRWNNVLLSYSFQHITCWCLITVRNLECLWTMVLSANAKS